MVSEVVFFKSLVLFFRLFLKHFRTNPRGIQRNLSHVHSLSQSKSQMFPSLARRSDLADHTLIFSVEGTLLKSSSLFPYFMLVAFEAGCLFRALVLLVLYPFVHFVGYEMGLNIMVMVCFFGIKKESFRAGTAVLPKFFLEDVGSESFEVLRRGGKAVGVTDLPLPMVESFLKDYLDIEHVVGRDLKVYRGYFLGLMEEKKKIVLDDIMDDHQKNIGITNSFKKSLDHPLLSHCKEIYLATEADRRSWHALPRGRYPKPLIFHDGRLAFWPTPMATLAMFIWVPFGIILAIFRTLVAFFLPYGIATPILAFTGQRLKVTSSLPKPDFSKPKSLLYACNHRTLMDPLYLSFGLKKPFTAVTYSVSRISELLSPIKTVRLTRDRDQDAKTMEQLLNQGDIIVFPEGTTCREPYLLRFSPLFSQLSHDIVPVAMETRASMFYATTASGLKCLDPLFFLMNPYPSYAIKLLDRISAAATFAQESSTFDVANLVQRELGKALGFECTRLTRKDKYLILAGNEGIVKNKALKPN